MKHQNILKTLIVLTTAVCSIKAHGQIFLSSGGNVSEYSMNGGLLNASVLPGISVNSMTSDGQGTIFVTSGAYSGSVAAYTDADSLIWQIQPQGNPLGVPFEARGLAYSQGNLFVTDLGSYGYENVWKVNATTGGGITLGAEYLANLEGPIAASAIWWYAACNGGILGGGVEGPISTGGPLLESGFSNITGLAADDQGDLFIADDGTGTIYNYPTSGLNSTVVSGLVGLQGLAIYRNDLFVTCADGTVGEYTTSGQTVNANLITGIGYGAQITIVPETSSLAIFLVGSVLCICRRRRP